MGGPLVSPELLKTRFWRVRDIPTHHAERRQQLFSTSELVYARTPPRRTSPQPSTRFCLGTGRVYPPPSTLIIIHPVLSWPTPDYVQKAPVCVRSNGARNTSTRHHPPVHRTAQHTQTSTKAQQLGPSRSIFDWTEVADRTANPCCATKLAGD